MIGTTKRLLPWLVAVGFFMESLDTTILNTAARLHRASRARRASYARRCAYATASNG